MQKAVLSGCLLHLLWLSSEQVDTRETRFSLPVRITPWLCAEICSAGGASSHRTELWHKASRAYVGEGGRGCWTESICLFKREKKKNLFCLLLVCLQGGLGENNTVWAITHSISDGGLLVCFIRYYIRHLNNPPLNRFKWKFENTNSKAIFTLLPHLSTSSGAVHGWV